MIFNYVKLAKILATSDVLANNCNTIVKEYSIIDFSKSNYWSQFTFK